MLKVFYFILLILGVICLICNAKKYNKTKTLSKHIKNNNNKDKNIITWSIQNNAATIFDVPTNIDEDELLHETGLFMSSIMDVTKDPCENFYEYACGNWPNSERVPLEYHHGNVMQAIANKIDQFIIQYLNNTHIDLKGQMAATAETKAIVFFQSCLKQQEQEFSMAIIKDLLQEEKSIFDRASKNTNTDWWMSINFLSPYGIFPLLPFNVSYNDNTRRYEIFINQPQQILNTFNNLTELQLLTKEMNNSLNELQIALEFEKNLTSTVRSLPKMEHITMLEFLEYHKNDAINWTRFFLHAFNEFNGSSIEHCYINNEIANFTDLERFLRKSNYENLRSYIKWRTILKFYEIWQRHLPNSVDIACLRHTEQYFTYVLMPWYSRLMFDEKRREDVLQITGSLKQNFRNMIKAAKWLNDEAESQVIAKLHAMDMVAGYRDKMNHTEIGDVAFENLTITPIWFKNLMALEAHHFRQRMNSCHHTVLPALIEPYGIQGYYSNFINEIFMPIGIFQMPFYHIQWPSSLKTGGIGYLIGREMAQSFNTKSYAINYDGKMENYLSATSERNFRERYNCLKNQYNKFIYGGVGTNAAITLDENLADNSGARIAYYSYATDAGLFEGMERPLPGFNYTNDELFFIKLAQTWCGGEAGIMKINRIKNYERTYEEFRVLGILQNMPEFSNVFQCKLGTEMNPLKKCTLW